MKINMPENVKSVLFYDNVESSNQRFDSLPTVARDRCSECQVIPSIIFTT
jgi:hypothetical protein